MAMVSVSGNELVRPENDRIVMRRAEERYAKRMADKQQTQKQEEPGGEADKT